MSLSVHSYNLVGPEDGARTPRVIDLWVLGAVVAGAVLRFVNLDAAPLWFDETLSAALIRKPWMQMLVDALRDTELPLHLVLLKAWSALAGSSAWALRLPSAVLSAATVPLVAALTAVVAPRSAVRWAAWLTAVSPFLLHHAQDARPYALFGFLATLGLLLIVRYVAGRTDRMSWWLVAVDAALLTTHYYAVFFVAAQAAALFVIRRGGWRDWAGPVTASLALIVVPAVLAMTFATHEAGARYAIGWLALPGVVWAMLTEYALLPSSAELHSKGVAAAWTYAPVAAATLLAAAWLTYAALRALPHDTVVLLLVIAACVVVGPFIPPVVYDIAVNPRYFTAGVPILFLGLAAGIAASVRSPITIVALLGLLPAMLFASVSHLREPAHGREDIRAATEWLERNVPANEPVLITSSEMAMLASFHWPQRRFVLYPPRGAVASAQNAAAMASELPFPGERAIYMVGREWLSDPGGALRAALAERYEPCPGARFRGITILCLRKPAFAAAPGSPSNPLLADGFLTRGR
jgi:uncharacterized membrane protein